MSWWTWLALAVFVVFAPSAAGLLLWQRLVERRYITLAPRDVPDGNEEYLG